MAYYVAARRRLSQIGSITSRCSGKWARTRKSILQASQIDHDALATL